MNASWWGTLTAWEKNIITAAAMEEHAASYEENIAFNGQYLKKMVEENGVVLKQFSDDIYDSFGEAAAAVFEETREHSALAAKVNDHYQTTLREVAGWRKIAEVAFANQRNRVLGI